MKTRKKKTHCKYGHEFSPENTYVMNTVRKGKPYTERKCKECWREASRKRLGLKQYRPIGLAKTRAAQYEADIKRMEDTGLKNCSTCKLDLPAEMYLVVRRDGQLRWKARCRVCDSKAASEWYFKNRTQILRRDKISRDQNNSQGPVYGLRPGQYEEMLIAQNEVCAICGEKEKVTRLKRLAIDHDHATEKVRELLCNRCNNVLGRVDDKIALLEKAIQYLKKHNEIHELEQMVTL